MPEVSAILVNYNAGAELCHAIDSIRDDLATRTWEAVVVDNASTDGSAEDPARFGPNVTVVRNRENVGFARAVNQGLAQGTAPLVLVMNPDSRLVKGACVVLEEELTRWPTCAVAGPRILDPDGSVQGSARGDPDMLTGVFGRTAFLRRVFPNLGVSKRNVVTDGARDASVEVDWISGACILARRAALEEIGGFDPAYFLYWEDADLCRRLRARGHTIRYVPRAAAVHRVGHSSKTASELAIRAFHESAFRYYATHVAPRSAMKRAMARVLLGGRRWVQLQLTGSRRPAVPPRRQSPGTP